MIYFLGDLHFTDHYEWSIPAFKKFIDWFKQLKVEPDSSLIQLGDVFDKAANYGITIKLVTDFFDIASKKFHWVYIVGGNHDFSFRKNHYQYAASFLESSFDNISHISAEEILTLYQSTKIGFLPFQKILGETLDNYYSEKLIDQFYNCDIICGHVAIKEEGSFFGGMDISKFSPNTKFVLGHIHSRNGKYKEYYTGSIMPFRTNEEKSELPRALLKFNPDTKQFENSITIPNIIKFESAIFGDKLPLPVLGEDIIKLYTIKNCKHLHEAKSQYPDHYIYGIEKPVQTKNNVTVSKKNLLMEPKEALSQMIKEQKVVIKRSTLQLVKELLDDKCY